MKNFVLNNGLEIPAVGLGTWQSAPQDAYNATLWALEAGYRLIDTAYVYGNERQVGKAVRDSGLKREEVFITTKLPADIKTKEGAESHLAMSLENLGMDYLDLYLIHAPWPWSDVGSDCTSGNIAAWESMTEAYRSGICKSIGVSNFHESEITPLIAATGVTPAVNQIRFFIGNTQEAVTGYCRKAGILVQAYSPMATGNILDNPILKDMAQRYGVTLAQLCIKYCLQRGCLPLPKSVHKQRIIENFKLDFTVSEEDINLLDSLKGIGPVKPYRS